MGESGKIQSGSGRRQCNFSGFYRPCELRIVLRLVRLINNSSCLKSQTRNIFNISLFSAIWISKGEMFPPFFRSGHHLLIYRKFANCMFRRLFHTYVPRMYASSAQYRKVGQVLDIRKYFAERAAVDLREPRTHASSTLTLIEEPWFYAQLGVFDIDQRTYKRHVSHHDWGT